MDIQTNTNSMPTPPSGLSSQAPMVIHPLGLTNADTLKGEKLLSDQERGWLPNGSITTIDKLLDALNADLEKLDADYSRSTRGKIEGRDKLIAEALKIAELQHGEQSAAIQQELHKAQKSIPNKIPQRPTSSADYLEHADIRKYLFGLDPVQRRLTVQEQVKAGNDSVLAAVLYNPLNFTLEHRLADAADAPVFIEKWREGKYPQEYARLRAVQRLASAWAGNYQSLIIAINARLRQPVRKEKWH